MIGYLTQSISFEKLAVVLFCLLAIGLMFAGGGSEVATAQETDTTNSTYEWVIYTNEQYSENITAINSNGTVQNIESDVFVQNTVVDDHGRLFIVGEDAVEVYNINNESIDEVYQFNISAPATGDVAITETEFYWMSDESSNGARDAYRYDLDTGNQTQVWSWTNFTSNSDYTYDGTTDEWDHFADIGTNSDGHPLIAIHTTHDTGTTAIINASGESGDGGELVNEFDKPSNTDGSDEVVFSGDNYYRIDAGSPYNITAYDKATHGIVYDASHTHDSQDEDKFGFRASDGAHFMGIPNSSNSELYRFDSNGKSLVTNYAQPFTRDTIANKRVKATDTEIVAFTAENFENLTVERLSYSDGSKSYTAILSNQSYVDIRAVAYSTDSATVAYGGDSGGSTSNGTVEVSSITNESGDPINNTTVSVYNSSDGTLIFEQTAEDAYLNFSIEAGDYEIVANASGYEATSQNITVYENQTTSISFTLNSTNDDSTTTEDSDSTIISGGDDGSLDNYSTVNIVLYGVGSTVSFLFLLVLALYTARKARQL